MKKEDIRIMTYKNDKEIVVEYKPTLDSYRFEKDNDGLVVATYKCEYDISELERIVEISKVLKSEGYLEKTRIAEEKKDGIIYRKKIRTNTE